MKNRCYDPNNVKFARYGGRGIVVCERWRDSFENFLSDMGERPKGKSIERINNDGNYEPGNCRWATQGEQMRNAITTHNLTFRGKTQCMTDWAHDLGVTPPMLYYILDQHDWNLESAFTSPHCSLRGSGTEVNPGAGV